MILEVSRGHIKVGLGGKVFLVPGEMLFPSGGKMGFVIYKNGINLIEPAGSGKVQAEDTEEVIRDIRQDFEKGGHTLIIEP